MTRSRLRSTALLFAAVAVAASLAPVHALAAADDPDEGSGLSVIGDFNRDGIADLAKASAPAGDHSLLTVLLGRADGSYQPMALSVALGRTPRSMVVADFNRDGNPDLIVGDEDGSLTLFLGDGTGRLVPAGEIAHLDSVISIAVGDFNRDGIPDVAISDWRASAVTVLLGNGNGSFRRESSFPLRMPGVTPHLTTADFNGDGILDLAVVYDDEDGDTFTVMLGSGHGTFTYAPELSLVRDPNSHCPT